MNDKRAAATHRILAIDARDIERLDDMELEQRYMEAEAEAMFFTERAVAARDEMMRRSGGR